MKIFRGVNSLKEKIDSPVLTIGNFDGVHIGHQEIIEKTVEKAKSINGSSVVMMFDPHPRTFFNPGSPQKQITTLEQRVHFIENLGVDYLIVQVFNKQFSEITAGDFVKRILVKKLNMAEVIISNKFKFGKNAEGNVDLLKSLSSKFGYTLTAIENRLFRHTVVSSSFIRQSIVDGEMEIARLMLGRPYSIFGEVYPDTQRGTSLLNTPTSNIKPDNDLIPAFGIYASVVNLAEGRYPSATYIGTRPTFNGTDLVIETHIIGFNGSLYGKRISIEFYKKTRDDKKFEHLSELLHQIKKDVQDVLDYLQRHKDDPHFTDLIWNI